MAQYPATASGTFRLVTKADTASTASLGSGTVSNDAGVANTYGSWAQIVASTSAESYITTVGINIGGNTLASADLPVLIELGTGGAGSEVVKWEALVPLTVTTPSTSVLVPVAIPFRVTSGKRIAVRARVASTSTFNITAFVFGLPITQTEGN